METIFNEGLLFEAKSESKMFPSTVPQPFRVEINKKNYNRMIVESKEQTFLWADGNQEAKRLKIPLSGINGQRSVLHLLSFYGVR